MNNISGNIHYRIDISALAGDKVKCNLNCSYCHKDFFPVNSNLNGVRPYKSADALELLERIYLFDKRKRKIHYSGRAEPLVVESEILENELKEINDRFPMFEKVMTTNAFLLRDKADLIKNCGINRINVSVHGNSFNNKKYCDGIKSAIKSDIDVCLNVVFDPASRKRIERIFSFAEENNLSVKLFPVLGISLQETMKIVNETDNLIKNFATDFGYDEMKNRMYYKLISGVKVCLKYPKSEDTRPYACRNCDYLPICNEGCWD